MTASIPSRHFGRPAAMLRRVKDFWNRLGGQAEFYARTIASIGDAVANYRIELIRAVAGMSLGTGALMLIGGTVVIVAVLTMFAGGVTAVQGYNALADVGVEALTGFVSAFVNTRLTAPLISTVGLAATIGAGATAQIGAMRINEEIDPLEVIGVRSVAYLASSRVAAGVIVVVPLFCVAVLTSYWAAKLN
jgi:phospholipid/cholesterol/gamma-HCH transport system permease protein